jgi:hypothetical protein
MQAGGPNSKSDSNLFSVAAEGLYEEDFPELQGLLYQRAQANGTTSTTAQELANWQPITVDASESGSIARCQLPTHSAAHTSDALGSLFELTKYTACCILLE